jgi:hypothetical protein
MKGHVSRHSISEEASEPENLDGLSKNLQCEILTKICLVDSVMGPIDQ